MYLEFAQANWHLFLALFVIAGLIASEPLRKKAFGVKSLNPMELTRVMTHEDVVVIDVSDKAEFTKGHLPNAMHIPLKELSDRIKTIEKFKGSPVVLSCQMGNKASKAGGILKKNEFTNIRLLEGGVAAWQKENMPIEK